MTTLQRYKPIPQLTELTPGYTAGWKYDVLIIQAEPEEKIGSIFMAEETKKDELGASVLARIVDMSPLAFSHADWVGDPPYQRGDLVLTKRYPAGCQVVGADGRKYAMVKDEEIIGLRHDDLWSKPKEQAA